MPVDEMQYLRTLIAQYSNLTGGGNLYQHASQPTPNTTHYHFTSGSVTSLRNAEAYMRWAIAEVESGREDHASVQNYAPTKERRA